MRVNFHLDMIALQCVNEDLGLRNASSLHHFTKFTNENWRPS